MSVGERGERTGSERPDSVGTLRAARIFNRFDKGSASIVSRIVQDCTACSSDDQFLFGRVNDSRLRLRDEGGEQVRFGAGLTTPHPTS